ncbi:MAG: SDR family oxidoreductase [Acidimicrobiales bacterium]|nr:SDR family oxidoreductase [Acidimicrobiales bacterium]
MVKLEGKTALVTGAASGIGEGMAVRLAESGANLALCDLQSSIHEVAERIKEDTGASIYAVAADVRNHDEVYQFVNETAERFAGLDIVIANAGVWRPTDPLEDSKEKAVADWDLLVNTNLKGVYLTGRAAIPHLVANGDGFILNIATDHICPPPGFATGGGTRMDVYDASKWGINGLTQSWAKRLAEDSIRVNAFCMDATDSAMIRYASGQFNREMSQEIVDTWMKPQQIADLMLELYDEGPDGRSGENIGIWLNHPIELPPRRDILPSRHP